MCSALALPIVNIPSASPEEKSLTGICATHMMPCKCKLYQEDGTVEIWNNVKLVWFDPSSQLTYIPAAVFIKFPRLRDLRMSGGIATMDKAVFQNATELRNLELTDSKLKVVSTEVFKNAKNLGGINLHSNEITEIEKDAFAKLPELRSLDLSDNSIRIITSETFSYISSLVNLNLNDNKIETIEDSAFNMPNLIKLSLSHNNIHAISFDLPPQLSILELISTNIVNVRNSLKHLPEFTELYLDNNHLMDITLEDFIQLRNLELLTLRNTSINLPAGLKNLSSDSKLRILDLSQNGIEEDSLILLKFTAFSKLEVIYLEHNSLKNISEIERFVNLKNIYLFGNKDWNPDLRDSPSVLFIVEDSKFKTTPMQLSRAWRNPSDITKFVEYAKNE